MKTVSEILSGRDLGKCTIEIYHSLGKIECFIQGPLAMIGVLEGAFLNEGIKPLFGHTRGEIAATLLVGGFTWSQIFGPLPEPFVACEICGGVAGDHHKDCTR